MNSTLHSELASWTSRALQVTSRYPVMAGAPGAATRAGEPAMATVVSALQRTALHLNQRNPLCNLPLSVMLCICSYLDAPEALLLSHTSHAVRAALLGAPELWCSLPIVSANIWLQENAQNILSTYLGRSDPLPFELGLVLAGSTIAEQVSLLARNMHRMAALRFLCIDRDSDLPADSWMPLLRQVFSEPAPQLATLDIYHSPLVFRAPLSAFEPALLRYIAFANAPSLRQVKLARVRLPASLDYPAFQNVTVFFYDLFGMTTAADLHVLSSMPRLEVFSWSGALALFAGDAETDCAAGVSWPQFLHTVLLSFRNNLSAANLRGILPVHHLRELWISTPADETSGTIPSLYAQSLVHGASVGCSSTGLTILLDVVHPGESGSTSVAVNPRRMSSLVSSLLAPFSSITWLSIYEYLWDSEVTGTPPVLPAVTVLSVCLASSDDHDRHWQVGCNAQRYTPGCWAHQFRAGASRVTHIAHVQ